jgi:drug/metabolite transporter (DMT)-like permease
VTPSGHRAASRDGPAPQERLGVWALPIRLVINLVVPVLTYVLLRPHVHSDVTALVIGAAIPTAYTACILLCRRRLDAIGAFAIACLAIGLLLVLVTGGNELVFKLREEIWTGPLGLVCLISVAMRRPLLSVVLRRAARRDPQLAERIGDPRARRVTTVTTGVIGAILLVHAMVIVALALTTSTSTFLAVKLPLTLAIVGGGLAALVWWMRRQYASRWNRHEAAGPPGPARQHGPGSSLEPMAPAIAPTSISVQGRRLTMPTVTIPRTDITSDQISAALRNGLDDRYDVLQGRRMNRLPIGDPEAAGPNEIVVGKGPSPMVRAQVTIIRQADHTDIRITPGGVAGDLLMNTLGIARKIRRVLLDAPGIGS